MRLHFMLWLDWTHGLLVPCETLRGWMRDAGIWLPRAARRKAIQQPRVRRQYFGELIRIDGSEHHWFEDRGPYCSVLTYVDDATSRLQLLRFVEEGTACRTASHPVCAVADSLRQ
jgi:hypothetical protein